MVYIFDRLDQYTDEAYEKHLSSLPAWRRKKALQYKKLDDRKRSVLAFVLLQHALREEYGIAEIPEFVYNEFGKPSLPNLSIHFSLSHCKDAVVCAVSDHNIGVDVENIVPYKSDVAQRVCTEAELEMLEQSENKDSDFIKLWTMKESFLKAIGCGLSRSMREVESRVCEITNLLIIQQEGYVANVVMESGKLCISVCCEQKSEGDFSLCHVKL